MIRADLHFLAPGDPDQLTGGYAYNRRIVAGLRERGMVVRQHRLPDTFPDPGTADRRAAAGTLRSLPDGATAVVDGLALGTLPDLVEEQSPRLCLIALFHQPLAVETGLAPAVRERIAADERRALAACKGIITTSGFSARQLMRRGLDARWIVVVCPGTDVAPLSPGSGLSGGVQMLCVASVIPRKGQDLLVEALAGLRDRDWRCSLVGDPGRAPVFVATLRERIRELGLDDRITLEGGLAQADLDRAWSRADLFVLASRYEGFGMVLTEAVARGLPVVATDGGAITETVPEGTGVIVPEGDVEALRAALASVLDSAGVRDRLAEASLRARAGLPDWDASIDAFHTALQRLGSA